VTAAGSGGIRPVPACAVFAEGETAGAWGDVLRAAAPFPVRAEGRTASREDARLRSAAVFGSRFFAEVVTAMDLLSGTEDAGVTVRMVAADTGLADSAVRPVMRRLCDGDLIAECARAGGARGALHYQVRPTPLWTGVLSACTALA
jgi:hypothetical protein